MISVDWTLGLQFVNFIVNPGVRDEEIEFFREQLKHFEHALEHARLRLDSVRVIVAV